MSSLRGETKIRIFTLVLVIVVIAKIILNYYHATVDREDRLTAKRMEQAMSMVVAKYVGVGVTYDDGRICWSEENSKTIKSTIAEMLLDGVFPVPNEKGYYYYMYLTPPYTVIKLPYKKKANPEIDLEVVTELYIMEKYPINEYVQVDLSIPDLLEGYEDEKIRKNRSNHVVVCLNA